MLRHRLPAEVVTISKVQSPACRADRLRLYRSTDRYTDWAGWLAKFLIKVLAKRTNPAIKSTSSGPNFLDAGISNLFLLFRHLFTRIWRCQRNSTNVKSHKNTCEEELFFNLLQPFFCVQKLSKRERRSASIEDRDLRALYDLISGKWKIQKKFKVFKFALQNVANLMTQQRVRSPFRVHGSTEKNWWGLAKTLESYRERRCVTDRHGQTPKFVKVLSVYRRCKWLICGSKATALSPWGSGDWITWREL